MYRSYTGHSVYREPAGSRQSIGTGALLLNYRINMALSEDLLEILVCSLCKAPLDLKPDGSGLKCVQCHRVYPIRNDLPIMMIEEAKIEE